MTQAKQQDKIQEIMGLVDAYLDTDKKCGSHTYNATTSQARALLESKLRELVREPLGYKGGLQSDDKVTMFFDNTECATTWFESFMDSVDFHNITSASGEA